jgi:hypothetical protein
MAGLIPDAAAEIASELTTQGLKHEIIGRLTQALQQRSRECVTKFRL